MCWCVETHNLVDATDEGQSLFVCSSINAVCRTVARRRMVSCGRWVHVLVDLASWCSRSFVPPRDVGACQSTSSGRRHPAPTKHPKLLSVPDLFASTPQQHIPRSTTMSDTVEISAPAQLSTLLSSSRVVVVFCKQMHSNPVTQFSGINVGVRSLQWGKHVE
jgi:hypothetical protein